MPCAHRTKDGVYAGVAFEGAKKADFLRVLQNVRASSD
jgi:hypothetical protein